MSLLKPFIILLLMLGFIGLSAPAQGQEASKEEQEMMAKWMAYATPGDNHKLMAHFVGDWNAAIKIWMKPGAPPAETTGVESAELLLGGRFLKTTFKSLMPGMGEMEGFSLMGFDNSKKVFSHLWTDSFGTGFFLSEGTADATGKEITLKGVWPDIMTGGTNNVRIVMTLTGPDSHTMAMFMSGGLYGPTEFKSMEVAYTRKK